ncbi:MAG: alanine racemase [Chloroflexi bacterium]|nr:alanine racemase [Chloroflexota bacterium]
MDFEGQTIWLEINLGAIRRNIQRIHLHTQRPVMAVVKANAYGHGLLEVSRAAGRAGASMLCVARIEEALKLRQAEIKTPILVMGYTAPNRVAEAAYLDISLMVNTPELAEDYNAVMKKLKGQIAVHAKIDTGMGRLGVLPEEGCSFGHHISKLDGLLFEGLFTHFASADDPKKGTTSGQIQKFDQVIEGLKTEGIRPRIIHAANSAASIYFPGAWYDAVRPGISIYGLHPSAAAPLPLEFEPALTWKCRLSSVRALPPGSGIGYNHRYVTTKSERIGAVSAGYADGLRRRPNNTALIGGKRVKQAGVICMDQSMWLLEKNTAAKAGDEVVLLGRQGDQTITAEELGRMWNTINYEVVCGLASRIPRFYIDE